jgi:acetyltransferase-like isoleucine patch superfamily enzyme
MEGLPGAAVVADSARVAESAQLGPGTIVHDGARIGADAVLGASVVVHPGTEIGDRCLIEDGVVLGKRPRLRAGSRAPRDDGIALVLEPGATVCCGAIVYAGSRVAADAIIGDQACVRERVTVGEGTVVGRGSSVEFGVQLGARVLIQTNVYVTAETVVEDDVFLGPCVVTTNDDTMGRHPRGSGLRAPVLRRACRVGGGAVLVPGVVIGEEAFVAAGAVVTADVPDRAVVMGVPARVVRQVADEDLIERWR